MGARARGGGETRIMVHIMHFIRWDFDMMVSREGGGAGWAACSIAATSYVDNFSYSHVWLRPWV